MEASVRQGPSGGQQLEGERGATEGLLLSAHRSHCTPSSCRPGLKVWQNEVQYTVSFDLPSISVLAFYGSPSFCAWMLALSSVSLSGTQLCCVPFHLTVGRPFLSLSLSLPPSPLPLRIDTGMTVCHCQPSFLSSTTRLRPSIFPASLLLPCRSAAALSLTDIPRQLLPRSCLARTHPSASHLS